MKRSLRTLPWLLLLGLMLLAPTSSWAKSYVSPVVKTFPPNSTMSMVFRRPGALLTDLEVRANAMGFGQMISSGRAKFAKEMQRQLKLAKAPKSWGEMLGVVGLAPNSSVGVSITGKDMRHMVVTVTVQAGDIRALERLVNTQIAPNVAAGRSYIRRQAFLKRLKAGLPRQKIPGGVMVFDPMSKYRYAILKKRFFVWSTKTSGLITAARMMLTGGAGKLRRGFSKFSAKSMAQMYIDYKQYNKLMVYGNPAMRKMPPQMRKMYKSMLGGAKDAWMEVYPYSQGYKLHGWVSADKKSKSLMSQIFKLKARRLNTLRLLPASTSMVFAQGFNLLYMRMFGQMMRAMGQAPVAMMLAPWELLLGQEGTMALVPGGPGAIRVVTLVSIQKPKILGKQINDMINMLGPMAKNVRQVNIKGIKVRMINLASLTPPQRGKRRRRRRGPKPRGFVALAQYRNHLIVTYEMGGQPLSLMKQIVSVAKGKAPSLASRPDIKRTGGAAPSNFYVYASAPSLVQVARGFVPPVPQAMMAMQIIGLMGQMYGTSYNRGNKMIYDMVWRLPTRRRKR